MKKKILLIGVVFAGLFAQAQESEKEGLKINGYIDTYYKSNFGYNGGAIANDGLSPYGDSFELGNVNLKLSQDFGKAGFVAQVAFGSRAELANFDSNNSDILIQQAYVYYKPTDKITLTAGNFSTFLGYEVIDAPANFHYSVSNLFQNGPYYHTGAKMDVNLGEGLSFMVGMFNQMDRKSNAQNGLKNYNGGAQLKYNKENFNFYLNYLGGHDELLKEKFYDEAFEPTIDNIVRNQIDLVADYRMDKIYVAINPTFTTYNFMGEKSKAWYGAAGYAQYTVSDKLAIGGRLGYIKNEDKLPLNTGRYSKGNSNSDGDIFFADEEMFDITLSAPMTLADGLKIIPEIRMDQAKHNIYMDADGDKTNKQFTVGIAAMYSF